MKKISLVVCLCLFLLTGCKEDRLVCTTATESEDFKLETKYVFNFANGKMKKASMKTTGTLLGELNDESAISEYTAAAESSAETYNKTEGIKAQVSSSKNKVTLTVDIISAGLSEEDKEKYGMNSTRDELKEMFESNEYTCK